MYKSISLPPPPSPPQGMRKRSFYAFSLGVFLTCITLTWWHEQTLLRLAEHAIAAVYRATSGDADLATILSALTAAFGAKTAEPIFRTATYDNTRYDNVVSYWGQNSFGATNATDTALWQQPISYYCNDDAVDVFPIAFVTEFFGTGDLPVINLANTCNTSDNTTFSGTELLDCSGLADDITTCQTNGKIVTISLGGSTGAAQFTSDDEAATFAETIWNVFLGGSSDTRPFGDAVLDGVDLDIEGGTTDYFSTFISTLRSYFDDADKDYYVTGAPQCVYPDAIMGTVLNNASFDAVYVQFYNNECGLQNADTYSDWDFGIWDYWARYVSLNSDVKIFIGAPAASLAAGSGYVDVDTLSSIAVDMRNTFPSFGGVMLWDESQAYANDRYDLAIKEALTAAGGTGFTYPECTAADYVSGTDYVAGDQVTYDGYIWEANWWSDSVPSAASSDGDWSIISACSNSSSTTTVSSSTATSTTTETSTSTTSTTSSTTSSTFTSTTTTLTTATSTTTSATATATGVDCATVSAWSATATYWGGDEATYESDLWMAQWWSYNDVPGGAAGVWVDEGACTDSFRAQRAS